MRKANIAADIKRAQTLAEDMLENNVETDDENFYADVEFEDIPMGEVPDRFDEEACEEKDKKALVKSWTKHMLQVSKQRSEAEEPAADFLRQRGIKLRAQKKGKKIIRFQQFFEEDVNDAYDIDISEKRMCEALQIEVGEENKQEVEK